MSWTWKLAQALDLVGGRGHSTDEQGLPVRNAPSPLAVFVPFVRQRGLRRARRQAHDLSLPNGEARGRIAITAGQGWRGSTVTVMAGDVITMKAAGRVFLNRALEVSVGPRMVLWYRIGDGPVERMTQECEVIEADREGELRFQINLPGGFDSPHGEPSADNPPPPMTGVIEVEAEISKREGGSADTSQKPAASPGGWSYLWRLGKASIFRNCEEQGAICCHTNGDVGILQYPVDVPLDEGTELRWDWLAEQLPSTLPEHTQPTHDYLSLAVEFDNGLDLTYMWSCALPTDTIFQCPLPWWDQRETHWVLRTPRDGLDVWHAERRKVMADYAKAIAGPLPKRIVKVWLIANSAFQDGEGRCRYRKIALRNGSEELEVAG